MTNKLQPELDIHPLTIISDRYGGSYSDAQYTAWRCDPDDVPGAINAGDKECEEFWRRYIGIVGKGDTPNEALTDLYEKIQQWLKEQGWEIISK